MSHTQLHMRLQYKDEASFAAPFLEMFGSLSPPLKRRASLIDLLNCRGKAELASPPFSFALVPNPDVHHLGYRRTGAIVAPLRKRRSIAKRSSDRLSRGERSEHGCGRAKNKACRGEEPTVRSQFPPPLWGAFAHSDKPHHEPGHRARGLNIKLITLIS